MTVEREESKGEETRHESGGEEITRGEADESRKKWEKRRKYITEESRGDRRRN